MILQIDSSTIQDAVQTAASIGLEFLPANFKILAPTISFIITALTAFVIRSIEKGKLKKQQRQELRQMTKAYLNQDHAYLTAKINELQNDK